MKEEKIKIKKPSDILRYVNCPNCKKKLTHKAGYGDCVCAKCKKYYLFIIE